MNPSAVDIPLPPPMSMLKSSRKTRKAKKGDVSTSVSVSASVTSLAPADGDDTQSAPAAVAGTKRPGEDEGEGNSSDGWTKVERRKAKKARKNEAKADGSPPRFFYVNGRIVQRRDAVGIDDVRDVVLHLLGDAPPQDWLKVDNTSSIAKVVVLFIPGITPAVLRLPPRPTSATANPNLPLPIPAPSPTAPQQNDEADVPTLPFIAATFSHACPTRAPGDANKMHSVLAAFFQGPITPAEQRRQNALRSVAKETTLADDPVRYLLTPEQMLENEYPVPRALAGAGEGEDRAGWVELPARETSLADEDVRAKVFAIDCEMCLTEDGKSLTRVCMIDYDSDTVVYDQLVKPPKPITDYLTQWSGITAEALEGVTTTLPEVQQAILDILAAAPGPTPILLGHSLESDLRALQLAHARCIDTALVFHHTRGRPLKPGLAWLTRRWLSRTIQAGGPGGHNPEEDARACADLLRAKVKGGPGFGEFKTAQESIFERLARKGTGASAVRTAVADRGNPGTWHGAKATTAVACADDAEVLAAVCANVPTHHFVFGRFTGLADSLGWTTPKAIKGVAASEADVAPAVQGQTPVEAFATLDARLRALHATLPPRTALVVVTGHDDPRSMAALNARKTEFENAVRSGRPVEELAGEARWTAADVRALEEAVETTKRGLLFLCIT